jgi:hypothetical protein
MNLQGEIVVLEKQIARTQLKPIILDPELIRLSQDASETQRARLTQLGYGVLRPTQANSALTQPLEDNELAGAQRAQSRSAELQLERTAILVKEGVIARDKLDAAATTAEKAKQDLREREDLIRAAKAGSDTLAHAETAILHDTGRARAERSAEVAELGAMLSERQASLLQLHLERNVTAPFSGTVVYRHPTPALASDGQVILALAKGPGFLATVQLPAREASMLATGQELQMKLQHSLVSEEVTGRLQSVQLVPGYPNRRDLLIECELPPEQFAAFSSGTVAVTLQWRPLLYTDRFAQAGMAVLLLSAIASIFTQLRAKAHEMAATNVDELEPNWTRTESYSAEQEEVDRVLAQIDVSSEEFAGVGQ